MLLAARKKQLGDSFRMRQFMDSSNAAGLVPASLRRWELTGSSLRMYARVALRNSPKHIKVIAFAYVRCNEIFRLLEFTLVKK